MIVERQRADLKERLDKQRVLMQDRLIDMMHSQLQKYAADTAPPRRCLPDCRARPTDRRASARPSAAALPRGRCHARAALPTCGSARLRGTLTRPPAAQALRARTFYHAIHARRRAGTGHSRACVTT